MRSVDGSRLLTSSPSPRPVARSLFIAHLRLKPPGEYSGAESDLAEKIKTLDTDWLPNKRSWKMVSKGSEEEGDEDTHAIVAELRDDVNAMKADLRDVKALMEHTFMNASS